MNEARGNPASRAFRIATYNTKNLFGEQHPQHPKRPREMRELARMVGKIDADVLAVQEVENEIALAQLNARLAEPYEHCTVVAGNSTRDIHLGFMSRHPVSATAHRTVELRDDSGNAMHEFRSEQAAERGDSSALRFARDVLLATVTLGTHTLAVFNVHLKSRIQNDWSGNDSDDVRRAEARALFDIVSVYQTRHPQHLVAVVGDFNHRHDHESLAPVMALEYFDPVLEELVPNNTQLSTHWSKPRDRIDYVLLNPASRERYVPGSATVHREAGARKASDHYAVSVCLNLN